MNVWIRALIPCALVVLHNAQRMAPVPLFDELRLRLATDYVGVGNLFSAYLLAYGLFNVPAGILADKVNNKRLILAGVTLSLVASLGFALARSYFIAGCSRLVLGISGSFLYIPAVRYVVTSFPEERRGSAIGFVEVGSGLGMILSLSLLPILARYFNLTIAYLVLPVVALFVLFGASFGLTSQPPQATTSFKTRVLTLGLTTGVWYLLGYFFLLMLAHYCVFGWLPTFLRTTLGYSAVKAGLASTVVTAALILGSPLAGTLSDRLGARMPVLIMGSIMSILSLLLFLVNLGPAWIIAASLLSGTSMAFTIPVVMILAGEKFGAAGAGLAVSAAAMTGQIASALSGVVFGYTLQTSHTFTAVWGLALLIAAGSVPFLLKAGKTMTIQVNKKGLERVPAGS